MTGTSPEFESPPESELIDKNIEDPKKFPYIVVLHNTSKGFESISSILNALSGHHDLGLINSRLLLSHYATAIKQVTESESPAEDVSSDSDLGNSVDFHELFSPSVISLRVNNQLNETQQQILENATSIIIVGNSDNILGNIPEEFQAKIGIEMTEEEVLDNGPKNTIAAHIYNKLHLERHATPPILEEYKDGFRINIEGLSNQLKLDIADSYSTEVNGRLIKSDSYVWDADALKQLNKYLTSHADFSEINANSVLYINGIGFPFLYASVAQAFPDNIIQITDPKVNPVDYKDFDVKIPENFEFKEDPDGPISWDIEDRDGYMVISFTQADGSHWIPTTPEILNNIVYPEITDKSKPIVISKAASNVLLTTMVKAFQSHGVENIALQVPAHQKYTEFISPALIITGDHAQEYMEAFPVKTTEKILTWLDENQAFHGKNLNLIQNIREKLEIARAKGKDEPIDLQLFQKYAYILEDLSVMIDQFEEINAEHGIDEKEQFEAVVIQAVKLLLLPTEDSESVKKTESKLEEFSSDVMVFRVQFSHLFKNKEGIIPVAKIPHISVEIKTILEKIENPVEFFGENLWKQIVDLYQENHSEMATKLIENFIKYLDPDLRPKFYNLFYKKESDRDSQLVAMMRATDLTSNNEDDTVKYRYVGALNIQKEFQGFPLQTPYILEYFADIFKDCDKIVMRADQRKAKIYQRSLGAEIIDDSITFSGEFPTEKNSVLLEVDKDIFSEKYPMYF